MLSNIIYITFHTEVYLWDISFHLAQAECMVISCQNNFKLSCNQLLLMTDVHYNIWACTMSITAAQSLISSFHCAIIITFLSSLFIPTSTLTTYEFLKLKSWFVIIVWHRDSHACQLNLHTETDIHKSLFTLVMFLSTTIPTLFNCIITSSDA